MTGTQIKIMKKKVLLILSVLLLIAITIFLIRAYKIKNDIDILIGKDYIHAINLIEDQDTNVVKERPCQKVLIFVDLITNDAKIMVENIENDSIARRKLTEIYSEIELLVQEYNNEFCDTINHNYLNKLKTILDEKVSYDLFKSYDVNKRIEYIKTIEAKIKLDTTLTTTVYSL